MNKTINSSAPENRMDIVNTFVKFESNNYNQVSFHPIRICLCVNSNVNCSIADYNMTIYGKALSLDLVGVGQKYTPVLSYVKANSLHKNRSKLNQLDSKDARLMSLQSTCTKISYEVNSEDDEEMIALVPYIPYLYYSSHSYNIIILTNSTVDTLFQQLTIKLKIHQCPWGFIEQTNKSCECQLSIQNLGLDCDMDNYTIIRSERQWIGVTCEHNHGKGVPGIIAHQQCPFDYCRSDDKSFYSLGDPR